MDKLREYLNAERGRRISLAASLEINPSAISQWNEVPLNRVNAVSLATGIPKYELRPDVFDKTENAA
jgi:DNA-binding transcriptional regulator YdaS (Cro superfamily)